MHILAIVCGRETPVYARHYVVLMRDEIAARCLISKAELWRSFREVLETAGYGGNVYDG